MLNNKYFAHTNKSLKKILKKKYLEPAWPGLKRLPTLLNFYILSFFLFHRPHNPIAAHKRSFIDFLFINMRVQCFILGSWSLVQIPRTRNFRIEHPFCNFPFSFRRCNFLSWELLFLDLQTLIEIFPRLDLIKFFSRYKLQLVIIQVASFEIFQFGSLQTQVVHRIFYMSF